MMMQILLANHAEIAFPHRKMMGAVLGHVIQEITQDKSCKNE
jgi:hypothetical protein